jgi:hypothetical protein
MPPSRIALGVLFVLMLATAMGCQPAGQRNAMPAPTRELASERASLQAMAISIQI